jgi:thiamine biosynthesis protein ThiI
MIRRRTYNAGYHRVRIDKRKEEAHKLYQALLIKYAEIGIKGKNRHLFEDRLMHQMALALRRVDGSFETVKEMGRIFVMMHGDCDEEGAIEALQDVFGITGICPVVIVEDMDYDNVAKEVVKFVKDNYPEDKATFKINARRPWKNYPKDTMQLNADLGEAVLTACPWLTVDVHNPDIMLTVEVRQSGVYIYSKVIPGPGGLPVGTSGKAELLLSGGIDSPVAGYMISKRGVEIDAVYFHAPPYTSERAKQKVVDLAKEISRFTGPIHLHVINFTDIQLAIYEKCPHEELTIIMRRYMMRLAEIFAKKDGALGLITGESIGQVASQTTQSLLCTNAVCTLPVYRPLIGFDKQEIINISEKIGTFETSIEPYEDCCTIFVAKHPVTHPLLKVIEKSEHNLDDVIGPLMDKAVETAETILVK